MYKFYSLVPDSGILQILYIQQTDFLFMARGKILTVKGFTVNIVVYIHKTYANDDTADFDRFEMESEVEVLEEGSPDLARRIFKISLVCCCCL